MFKQSRQYVKKIVLFLAKMQNFLLFIRKMLHNMSKASIQLAIE